MTGAQISALHDSSADALLSQLNECARRRHSLGAMGVYLLGSICALFSLVRLGDAIGAAVISGIAAVSCFLIGRQIAITHKRRYTVVLTYELDAEGTHTARAAKAAVASLIACDRLWQMTSRELTSDWKHHAGASALIDRHQITAELKSTPPQVQTNIEVPHLRLSAMDLYFFPDRILVWHAGQYGAVPYPSLAVTATQSDFREEKGVPSDAEIIGHAWKYVNKSGRPDRRFANNYQIPVIRYGSVLMKCDAGLQVAIMTSRSRAAEEFVTTLCAFGAHRE